MSYHRGDVLTIIAMITSNMARAGHRSRVIVPAASANAKCAGLDLDEALRETLAL
jgi:hypothetical protein